MRHGGAVFRVGSMRNENFSNANQIEILIFYSIDMSVAFDICSELRIPSISVENSYFLASIFPKTIPNQAPS